MTATMRTAFVALAFVAGLAVPTHAAVPADTVIAIVGATLVDGNGGPPVHDAVVIVTGKKITAVGTRSTLKIPRGARVIDGTGKWLTPGFIDTNVHLSLYSGYESLVRYQDRFVDVAVEGAQLQLKFGVTTVRDSYGMLAPLLAARDKIERGDVPGARVLVAGNIVGWGGPWSYTFTGTRQTGLTLFQEQMNDAVAAGAGEELMNMTPDELREAIDKYLDKGVDFVKYGGTSHAFFPAMIGFSPAAQKALVDEVHKRGKVAETHATSPEGLRLAVDAGVDLIQHPEATDALIPEDLLQEIVSKKIVCSMLENGITGKPWADFEKQQKSRGDSAKRADSVTVAQAGDVMKTYFDSALAELTPRPSRVKTGAEVERDSASVRMRVRRENAERLIKAGALITTSTDNYRGAAPEFDRVPRQDFNMPGVGTIRSIEGLVELGMTPAQAIVAATKNGAIASHQLAEYGTVEVGKSADLLLLGGDPTADIHNIRRLSMVMKEGRMVDVHKLPEKPVFWKPVAKPAG